MKRRVVIAILWGISISALLAALEAGMPNRFWEYLQTPGFFTIILLWGHGGTVPDAVSELVMIGINAVAYGLIVLGIFSRIRPRSKP
jgi:hypothetical protein